jgi:hypothetical protein
MGGRAGVHRAVPDPDGAELRLQLHHHRAARHAVVARSHFMAARHRVRRHRRAPQAWRALPVPGAAQGGPRHLR